MKQQALVVAIISLITILFSVDMAQADRADRSRANREKARAWCAEYTRTHGGERCRAIRMTQICPAGMHRGKRFNRIRSNGYKTCIPGRKGQAAKKAIKKIHKPATKPFTNRVDRTKENHRKARTWCAEYTRTHGGAECRVKRMIRNCPTGLPHIAKRFKQFRSRGYKTCIRE